MQKLYRYCFDLKNTKYWIAEMHVIREEGRMYITEYEKPGSKRFRAPVTKFDDYLLTPKGDHVYVTTKKPSLAYAFKAVFGYYADRKQAVLDKMYSLADKEKVLSEMLRTAYREGALEQNESN